MSYTKDSEAEEKITEILEFLDIRGKVKMLDKHHHGVTWTLLRLSITNRFIQTPELV